MDPYHYISPPGAGAGASAGKAPWEAHTVGNNFGTYNPNPTPIGNYSAAPTPGYGYPAGNPTAMSYGPSTNTFGPPSFSHNVTINGVRLTDYEYSVLATGCPNGGPLYDGAYWYDRKTGCWGPEGGPTAGWIVPGLAVGGELSIASLPATGTGVFINEREAHPAEITALQAKGHQVSPGKYNMDAFGSIVNTFGMKVAQLFPNPLAQQISNFLSNLVPSASPSYPQSQSQPYLQPKPPQQAPYGVPGVPPGQMGIGLPPDYMQQQPPYHGQSFPPQQQQMAAPLAMGAGGASLSSLLSQLIDASKDKEKLNALLSNYGHYLNSSLVKTFLSGYMKNLEKGKVKGKKGKILHAGLKMLMDHWGVDKATSEGGSLFDFTGTGLDNFDQLEEQSSKPSKKDKKK